MVGLNIPKTLGSSFFKLGLGRVCNLLSQCTRDLTTPATMALQQDDMGAQGEAKKTWREVADAFRDKTCANSAEVLKKTDKKGDRTKVFE